MLVIYVYKASKFYLVSGTCFVWHFLAFHDIQHRKLQTWNSSASICMAWFPRSILTFPSRKRWIKYAHSPCRFAHASPFYYTTFHKKWVHPPGSNILLRLFQHFLWREIVPGKLSCQSPLAAEVRRQPTQNTSILTLFSHFSLVLKMFGIVFQNLRRARNSSRLAFSQTLCHFKREVFRFH